MMEICQVFWTLLGIEFEVPEFTKQTDGFSPSIVLEPGWYAVSANFLRGYAWRASIGGGRFVTVPQDSCRQLLDREPSAIAGYSIYLYEVPPVPRSTATDKNRCNRPTIASLQPQDNPRDADSYSVFAASSDAPSDASNTALTSSWTLGLSASSSAPKDGFSLRTVSRS